MGETIPLRVGNGAPPAPVPAPSMLPLPAEWLGAIADAVADALAERFASELARSPWMTRPEAAAYMGIPASRLEKDRTVPCHKWDGRVFYSRLELDDFLRGFDRQSK